MSVSMVGDRVKDNVEVLTDKPHLLIEFTTRDDGERGATITTQGIYSTELEPLLNEVLLALLGVNQ